MFNASAFRLNNGMSGCPAVSGHNDGITEALLYISEYWCRDRVCSILSTYDERILSRVNEFICGSACPLATSPPAKAVYDVRFKNVAREKKWHAAALRDRWQVSHGTFLLVCMHGAAKVEAAL